MTFFKFCGTLRKPRLQNTQRYWSKRSYVHKVLASLYSSWCRHMRLAFSKIWPFKEPKHLAGWTNLSINPITPDPARPMPHARNICLPHLAIVYLIAEFVNTYLPGNAHWNQVHFVSELFSIIRFNKIELCASLASRTLHLWYSRVGFPKGRDSPGKRDKGTEVSSLSWNKGTTRHAQNLAAGRAGTRDGTRNSSSLVPRGPGPFFTPRSPKNRFYHSSDPRDPRQNSSRTSKN